MLCWVGWPKIIHPSWSVNGCVVDRFNRRHHSDFVRHCQSQFTREPIHATQKDCTLVSSFLASLARSGLHALPVLCVFARTLSGIYRSVYSSCRVYRVYHAGAHVFPGYPFDGHPGNDRDHNHSCLFP